MAIAARAAADVPDDDVRRALEVNDGELEFLAQPPDKPVHHHHNRITIDAHSLTEGWVRLQQCHEHMDPFQRVEVVFDAQRARGLRVVTAHNIARAWVEGASVQLADVTAGARLCLELESRALTREADGSYTLRNGPYMRKFLDGYYPMRVTMEVRYPQDRLRFADIQPQPQPGFRVDAGADHVAIEAWFAGRLHTRLRFVPNTP